jgi:spectinomycin phosphotransferase
VLTPPVGLDEAVVARAADGRWGLQGTLRYVAIGAGSYHWLATAQAGTKYFLTVDDLRDKPWLGADPDQVFSGLCAAFETARALRENADLPFVVAPIRARGGDVACRLTARYSLAVFPFVEGQSGRWGDAVTAHDADALAEVLARLHKATPVVGSQAPCRSLELYGRAQLESALSELDRPWNGGPFAEPARRELAAKADLVVGWLDNFDDLAARLAANGAAAAAVTHGEPHPGNFIRTGKGLALIDWDTVALAPPERDLWMLDDAAPGALARYGQLSGVTPDAEAISFYRLAWTLYDIAAYTGGLRAAHELSRDSEKAWTSLRLSLEPDPTARPGPYRLANS